MDTLNPEFKICNWCCMDASAQELVLDETGRCNFCKTAEKAYAARREEKCITSLLDEIMRAGKGNKYDVIIGLSGGIDSTAALDMCVKEGLRPLCFSVDNGWNDPIADENIMRVVEGINAEQDIQPTGRREPAKAIGVEDEKGIPVFQFSKNQLKPLKAIKVPFFRYTIDNAKFKHLQATFLQAGVINAEIPSDHIIIATAYDMAAKYGVKYIISGGNLATESIMPYSWSYPARDLKHIKSIYRKFAHKKLTGLPVMSLAKFNYYKWVKGIRVVNILDWYDYDREKSIKEYQKRFGYKNYGEKHEESVYTKWFQNFYLYEKFGIDKRKAHYSSLIVSGQMTRKHAMWLLTANPVYPKLGLEERVIKYQKHEHHEYPTNEKLFNFISKIIKALQWKQ